MRFNDTLKIQIEDSTGSSSKRPATAKFSKVVLQENSPLPLPRTYHASCQIGQFMVVIGGEATSDLKDFWALDLD